RPSDLLERAAVGLLRLAAGPERCERGVDEELALPAGTLPDQGRAPLRQRATGLPRQLVGDPGRPVRDGPDDDGLRAIRHGDLVATDGLQAERFDGLPTRPPDRVEQVASRAR